MMATTQEESRSTPEDEAEVAPPPPMPVRTTVYLTPDGRVSFGALFSELVPVARALDPDAPLPPLDPPTR